MIACNICIKCLHIKPDRISLQQPCRSYLKGSMSLPISTVQVCQDLGVEYHAGFFQHLVDISIGVMPRATTIYRTSCFDRIASYYFTLPKALLLLKLSVHPGGGVNMALASDLMRLAASSAQAQARPRGIWAAVHSMWLFNKYKLQVSMSLDIGWANTQYLHWKGGATLEFQLKSDLQWWQTEND